MARTKIPSQYQATIQSAADTLGIPTQLIAEQINLESGWNPKAVSPAGAQGLTQFMPGTFKEYGPKGGNPFNATDSLKAYVAYMKYLLKIEKGSIQDALSAYNAGPGNLRAGRTYASIILKRSGVPSTAKAGPAGENSSKNEPDVSGGLADVFSFPGEIVDFFKDGVKAIESTMDFFTLLFQPTTYVRIASGFFGLFMLILAFVFLYKETK